MCEWVGLKQIRVGGDVVMLVMWGEAVWDICYVMLFFFFQAEDGIRDLVRSRGLGDVYKRQII